MCTNVIVFLQEEKETVDMCTNFIVFRGRKILQTFVLMLLFFFRGKETADICTNVIVFLQGEKETRHVY